MEKLAQKSESEKAQQGDDRWGIYIGHSLAKLRLPLREFRLLCEIAKWGAGKWCDSTVGQLASACRISRRNVKPAIDELKKRGLVETDRRVLNGGANWQNRYRYTPPIVSGGTLPVEADSVPSASGSVPNAAGSVRGGTVQSTPQLLFQEIYRAYPRKKGRADALKAIGKALKKEDFDFLLSRTKDFAASVAGQDPKFIPYPATWFNGERYHDEPDRKPKKQHIKF